MNPKLTYDKKNLICKGFWFFSSIIIMLIGLLLIAIAVYSNILGEIGLFGTVLGSMIGLVPIAMGIIMFRETMGNRLP